MKIGHSSIWHGGNIFAFTEMPIDMDIKMFASMVLFSCPHVRIILHLKFPIKVILFVKIEH